MGRVEYGTDGYPYKLSMSTGIDNTDGFKYPVVARAYKDDMVVREKFFTKADMVAMLTEILLEAEENTVRWYVGRVDGKSDDVVLMETLQEIIQQKINSLKGEV